MAELRELSENGIAELKIFLAALPESPGLVLPPDFLTNAATSEALPVKIEVSQQAFASRMEAGKYFYELFSVPEAAGLDKVAEIWAWLSCFHFEQLCPKKKDGSRKPGELARWIPTGHAFRYYRHLLCGPYLIYKAFRDAPERAAIVMCNAVDTPGDFVGQLASRQDFVQNKAVIDAATLLYFNPETGRQKRGSSPTERRPGTLRRFVDMVNQFDPVWDLYSMETHELIEKLPPEFAKYL